MKFTLASSLRGLKADALVVGWFEDQKLVSHAWWSALPQSTKKVIQRQLKRPGVTLEWGSQSIIQMPKGPWQNIVIFGLGKRADWSDRRNRLGIRRIVRQATSSRWSTVTIAFQRLTSSDVQLAVENSLLAAYDYRAHRQALPAGWPEVRSLTLVTPPPRRPSLGKEGREKPSFTLSDYKEAIRRGEIIAEMTNHARDLANTPGGLMTPKTLATAAVKLAKGRKLKVKILTPVQMEKLKMGALLGVGKGSDEPPRLIVIEYHGANHPNPSSRKEGADRPRANAQPLVIVGKGITFDSGGYNLKPGASMNEMHMDMSGGAAAMSAIAAIADLGLQMNVVAIIPAAENMVSGSGFRPGDILKSMSGKTIEIGSTDAEGRLILADALTYAQKFYTPKLIVDIATLAMSGLGPDAIALMTPNSELQTAGLNIGESSGDYCWPLPLWEEYESEVKGTFADLSNIGKNRYAASINAGMFLQQFIQHKPWIHLDTAGTMSSVDGQFLAKGASGTSVRWLVELARRMADGRLTLKD